MAKFCMIIIKLLQLELLPLPLRKKYMITYLNLVLRPYMITQKVFYKIYHSCLNNADTNVGQVTEQQSNI